MLCNPDLDVSTLPKSQRYLKCDGYDGKSMVHAIRRLNSGDLKFASFKGTCEQLLEIPGVRVYIINSSVPLVYSFSVSHVPGTFKSMAYQGAVQVACGYAYDRAYKTSSREVFRMGSSYVALSPESSATGVYAFGGDKPQTENAIKVTDFEPPCHVTYAVANVSKISLAPAAVQDILANVVIITS